MYEYYLLTGTRVEHTSAGTVMTQIPTFALLANIQGIVSAEHAEKIGSEMLSGENPAVEVHIRAVGFMYTELPTRAK